ncbi:hypothetical protein GCM10009839_27220 [Catenulispora yoronensis]|uniref:Uncharacterized protein n=1 Tax=Catenulispora yoronensis TaxID=450799 RepID=A0ABN2U2L4_9ACTN
MRRILVSGVAALAAITATAGAATGIAAARGADRGAGRAGHVVAMDTGWGNPSCPYLAPNCPPPGPPHV